MTSTRAAIVILVGALGACGGRFDSSGDDGGGGGGGDAGTGSDSGSGSDSGTGSDGGVRTQCPDTPPFGGSACPRVGLQCEYGNGPNPYCNGFFECTTNGWANRSGNGGCPPTDNQCPATYAAVPKGQDCTPQSPEGAECTYPEGECYCTIGAGGPPPPPGTVPKWLCHDAVPGCAEPRPRLGTTCTSEGQQCDYGSCLGGVKIECTSGAWHDATVACPL